MGKVKAMLVRTVSDLISAIKQGVPPNLIDMNRMKFIIQQLTNPDFLYTLLRQELPLYEKNKETWVQGLIEKFLDAKQQTHLKSKPDLMNQIRRCAAKLFLILRKAEGAVEVQQIRQEPTSGWKRHRDEWLDESKQEEDTIVPTPPEKRPRIAKPENPPPLEEQSEEEEEELEEGEIEEELNNEEEEEEEEDVNSKDEEDVKSKDEPSPDEPAPPSPCDAPKNKGKKKPEPKNEFIEEEVEEIECKCFKEGEEPQTEEEWEKHILEVHETEVASEEE